MGIGKASYEECRQKRMEENKKRMEDLNLHHLSNSLQSLSPKSKSSPMKKSKARCILVEKEMVAVRRSARVASNPAPVYVEVKMSRIDMPRRAYRSSKRRDLSNRVYASYEERAYALEKAQELDSKLQAEAPHQPTLVKSMLPSHVSGGFWLGLTVDFCRRHLPRNDEMVTLVDEQGNEFPTVYLARKTGLSGGWKGFAEAHDLVDGDAIIFQKINNSILKVYIVRASGFGEEKGVKKLARRLFHHHQASCRGQCYHLPKDQQLSSQGLHCGFGEEKVVKN